MTELFRGLVEMDSPLTEEDKVVYLLASLPESFGVLVTALEASPEVPKMEVVTERLLHEEWKLISCTGARAGDEKAMTTKDKRPRKIGPCHHCGKLGHYKQDCWKLAEKKAESQKEYNSGKHKTSKVTELANLSGDDEVLVVGHAWSVGASGSWIVDSGATCHMCSTRELFAGYRNC